MSVSEAEVLLGYGIDIERKVVFLAGAIDGYLYTRLVYALTLFKGSPCTIVINSDGGEVVQALAMIEAIDSYPGHVRTHATGACMSAAALILQAGDVRSATPDCSLLVHFGMEENTSGAEAKHNGKLTNRMKSYFRERTGRSAKLVNRWLEADTFFTSEEALKAKLIDEVTV